MEIVIMKTGLEAIQSLRDLFLHENNFQFIYNKCHQFGWADTYLFLHHEEKIGYGSVWGKDNRQARDAIFEFYLLPSWRRHSDLIFPAFRAACGATHIECQSNDGLLSCLLYTCCGDINAEAILFKEHTTTYFSIPGTSFRKQLPAHNKADDEVEYALYLDGETVATGGFVWNYNLPYIDMYYEVKEAFRARGFGSLMVQELKKEAYSMARVPAARCNIHNRASRATLLKGGMQVCGFILTGRLTEKLQ